MFILIVFKTNFLHIATSSYALLMPLQFQSAIIFQSSVIHMGPFKAAKRNG
jgi:hypothetical protein